MRRLVLAVLVSLAAPACSERQPLPTDPVPGPAADLVSGAAGILVRVTTDAAIPGWAAISGDRIVWLDSRSGAQNFYLYDISTGAESQLTTEPETVWYPWEIEVPAFSGNVIAWCDSRHSFPGIRYPSLYMYDISTGVETRLTEFNAYGPAVSGDRIVWADFRNAAWDANIYMYDVSNGVESQITTPDPANPSGQWRPAISGDRIAWTDYPWGGWSSVWVYDLSTAAYTRIPTDPMLDAQLTAISGDRVILGDVYDLTTGLWSTIPARVKLEEHRQISGNRIVWEDSRSGNRDVYMYDMATGVETRITTDPADQSSPAISGDRIIWWERGDIYLFQFAPTFQELGTEIDGHLASGAIDNRGVANSLKTKLRNAEAAAGRGDANAAIHLLNAFINELSGGIGGHITAAAAGGLITAARALIATLG